MSKTSEHIEQKNLIMRCFLERQKYPELEWLFSIPNGGHRSISVAKRMKAEGVKKGVPDLFLPIPRAPYCGLFIEMKVGYNKPSSDQKRWLEALSSAGYKCAVCYSADNAWKVLTTYLEGSSIE